jgi:phosphoglycolate phosphatase
MPPARPSCLIFDLDGTISDPVEGIGRSINHALESFGYPAIPGNEMSRYVGPPLEDTFLERVPGISHDVVVAMIAKYRERYGNVGYAENVLYPGIPEVLARLSSTGVTMGVCTTKKVDFAEQILAMFGLRHHFTFVSGGDIGVRKHQQLERLVADRVVGLDAVMIGDRATDIAAARANRLRGVGVLWGHGSREELEGAAPDRLLERPDQLEDTW